MPRPQPAKGLAAARGERCGHEGEAVVAQRARRGERPLEALGDGLARVPEPELAVEVVDRDEASAPAGRGREPVVAACSDGRVLERRDLEAPAVGQSAGDRALVAVLECAFHPLKSLTLRGVDGRTGAYDRAGRN